MDASRLTKVLGLMRENPAGVRFADLEAVCEHFFGRPRQKGSHVIYKMPWAGDPRINIQRSKDGSAKTYQVKQVLAAIDKRQELGGESL